MRIRFDDQVAIVTGSGGGLGKSYALELARRGARVVVNDLGGAPDGAGRSTRFADQTVKEISDSGGQAVASYDTVATLEGGEAIVKAALDSFGRVDIVINNAGILRDKTFPKLQAEELDAVLDVHLKGAFHVSQPAYRAMKEQGYGRFLFTASAAGLFGNFGQTNYGAAKMGLVGLSNVLAIEGSKHGIASNVIAPIANTRLTETILGGMAARLAPGFVTPLALYLVSRESTVTREIYSAGGGRYARVFIGLTKGWQSPEVPPIEEIAKNIDAIRHEDGYVVPESAVDELKQLGRTL